MSDSDSSICFSCFVNVLSVSLPEKFAVMFKSFCFSYINKYGEINLKDVSQFFSNVEWEINESKLMYIYRNYKYNANVFIKLPKVSQTYSSNRQFLKTLAIKQGISDSSILFKIDKMCKNLNVSYEYALFELNKTTSNKELELLISWFNFNYTVMVSFLKENKNFGREV